MSDDRRRDSDFIERISLILVIGAFLGGFIVLLDIQFVLTFWGQVIKVGKEGFSPEVKGVVLQSMLITGFAAVVGYWLGTTKQGQDQAKAVSKMAEAAAPTQAQAVAAARAPAPEEAIVPPAPSKDTAADPLSAETVNIKAGIANVNGEKKP